MCFDYDKDGKLDLVVANYVTWTVEKDLFCTLDGKTKSYCTPESYKGESPTLFRNRGDGTFEDVTKKAGLCDPTSKALGVALLDYDDDGWPDFVIANDTQPNKLYRNDRRRHVRRRGHDRGHRLQRDGRRPRRHGRRRRPTTTAAGRPSLIIGNFSNEMIGALPQRGQRPVRRRGAGLDHRPASAAHPHVRLLLLRLRPRRPARHLRRQRPRGRRHQRVQPRVTYAAAAAPVPQPGRQAVRGGHVAPRARRMQRPIVARGRGVRRLRQRRRPRRAASRPTTARRASAATTAATRAASCA